MRRVFVLLLVLFALGLAGCTGLIDSETGPIAKLTYTVLPDRKTVIFDASGTVGDRLAFWWDFGDGSGLVRGKPVETHVYAKRGVYGVRLCVEELASGSSGPPGGPPDPLHFDVASQGRVDSDGDGLMESWLVAEVNLLEGGLPHANIMIVDFRGRLCSEDEPILPWQKLTFSATGSYSPDGAPLWYKWEIVRIDPETGNPIPYPWKMEPEFIKREGETFVLEHGLPGPVCPETGPGTWTYRVRLYVSDNAMRRVVIERTIQVGYPG